MITKRGRTAIILIFPLLLALYVTDLQSICERLQFVSKLADIDFSHYSLAIDFSFLSFQNPLRSAMPNKTPVYFFSHGGVSNINYT